MVLEHLGYIDLPAHLKDGGFDHAAVYEASDKLYVAHTANDAIDVIDTKTDAYLYSINNLIAVAGALVSDEHSLVFTSNRGENTVGIFSATNDEHVAKIQVGIRPNGLAYDPQHGLLLAANVGDPTIADSFTVSLIDVAQRRLISTIPVPGRTRWTVFDMHTDTFFVNIADPPLIVAINARQPTEIARKFEIPSAGPHGLDFDPATNRLFCACDGKKLFAVDAASGKILSENIISGVPDVIFFNSTCDHLYVAIGDPGVIEVFDTRTMTRLETVPTEKGAHTTALSIKRNKIYAFLPLTHRAAVFKIH
jgi:DNA-binding beta-propeller fold protein YncE